MMSDPPRNLLHDLTDELRPSGKMALTAGDLCLDHVSDFFRMFRFLHFAIANSP